MKVLVLALLLGSQLAFGATVVRTSSNTSLSASDQTVLMSSDTYIVTLPAQPADGTTITLKCVDSSASGSVQVAAGSGDTVDSAANFFMQYTQSNTFVYDANLANWQGIGFW